MAKLNLSTLASNAARARASLTRQQDKVQKLGVQLIERVGTGGQTIQTSLGQVIVSSQTFDRPGTAFNLKFSSDNYEKLPEALKLQLQSLGVVSLERQTISGRAPTVSYRLLEK